MLLIGSYLAKGEMKLTILEALHPIINVLIAGLDVCHIFELKGNLTDSTVWNAGEAGDMNITLMVQKYQVVSTILLCILFESFSYFGDC